MSRADPPPSVALPSSRDELEARILERTRELAEVNAALKLEIERRKLVEQRLTDQAHRDALTGLANRKLFLEHLDRALARYFRRPSPTFAILMIDLDRFKTINDSLGHVAGDHLLVEVAARLSRCLRGVDTAARLGGDEFAVLVDGIDELRDARRTADRIQAALAEPIQLDHREVTVHASIGLAMMDRRYLHGEELVRDADTALYRAKDAGRGQTQVFDAQLHEAVLTQLQNESELSYAVERRELRLHYQPIYDLATDRIHGFEALVRWQHPTRGLVAPALFIPLAEETGLIRGIGRWVITEACAQLAAWAPRQPEPLVMGVNVSAAQLAESGLATHVATQLHKHVLAPSHLDLELTESTMMAGTLTEARELADLRELGVSISLDDFGTGYSCLSLLQTLAVSTLKLDRSFVTPIGTGSEQLAIVRAIVTLAQNLGLDLVAEGVETPAQLARLRELGCHYAQGYLLSRPVEAAAATALLEAQRSALPGAD